MKRLVACIVVLMSAFTSFNAAAEQTITVSGSTSISALMEVLAETYTEKTGTFVKVRGTSSSAGIRAANDGTSMFGMVSRYLKAKEVRDRLETALIAKDGIAVVVHLANPITELTIDQIQAVYKGEVTNWADIGGKKGPIVVVSRDAASGTRSALESILKLHTESGDKPVSLITPRAKLSNGNSVSKAIVATNPNAIAFISLGSLDGSVKALDVNGVPATVATIKSGDYPIARPFLLLYDKRIDTSARSFLSWILTPEAQKIVADKGYIAIDG